VCLVAAGCGGASKSGDGNLTLEQVKLAPSDIGPGWKLEKQVVADPGEADPGSTLSLLAGLGAKRVMNQIFTNGGERLQVNLVELPDTEKAGEAKTILAGEAGGQNSYGSRRNIAVEIITGNSSAKAAAMKALGLSGNASGPSSGSSKKVSFNFACVDNIDYMQANSLSNYLESYREGQPVDPQMQAVISSTSFGNTVSLLTSSGTGFKAIYSFQPASAGSTAASGVTKFSFDAGALPKKAGVPYVSISGGLTPVVTSLGKGDGASLTAQEVATCKAATSFWPTGDPAVQSIAAQAAAASGDAAKVQAIWKWVRDNIKYSGPVGTRYGTLKVLQQKYGRCWDMADVFVTLCRAAGVPARQVAGWLDDAGAGGGHVWAQAYLAGKGWISVDSTNDHVGSDARYLPFFATYDGAMPILYVKAPTID
jgi:hypothetical protein